MIVQRGRRIHNKEVGGGNVQILETLARGSKEQLITLSHDGLEKIQQELDQAKREREVEKWRVFVENVWGCLLNRITEGVNEISTMFGDNVQRVLDMVRNV